MQMQTCYDLGLDWTAGAAFVALFIWAVDIARRRRERRATARFLAQIMITEAAAAQLEISKIRTFVAPSADDHSRILDLLDDPEARRVLATRVAKLTFTLPAAVLDKADVFPVKTSKSIAYALAHVDRLYRCAVLVAEVEVDEIEEVVKLCLEQILETQNAIDAAFSALLKLGKA
jgi:hypothetical protein